MANSVQKVSVIEHLINLLVLFESWKTLVMFCFSTDYLILNNQAASRKWLTYI